MKIKRRNVEIFGDGPEIFLKLNGKPSIFFEDIIYFPKGVHKCPSFGSIVKTAGLDDSDDNEKINFDDIFAMEEFFEVGIEVWSKKPIYANADPSGSRYSRSILKYDYTHVKIVEEAFEESLNFHYDDQTDTCYFISDPKTYFSHLIRCKNWHFGCLFTFRSKKDKENHEKNCTTETKINVQQEELGLSSRIFDKARKFGLLPQAITPNRSFIFFDIESVLPKSDQTFGKSKVENDHKLVSIAANSYINNQHKSKVWTVVDSSIAAEVEIVRKFLNFCHEESERDNLDSNLEHCYKKVCEMSQKLQKGIRDPNFDLNEISRIKNFIKPQLQLSIFGYNSSRYDLSIIFARICQVLDDINFDRTKINMIKKGLSYFSLSIGRLTFKDLLNFNCPMKLDKYLQIWGSNCKKLVYPYEKFSSIDEIRACKVFPPITEFETTLNPNIDISTYNECKELFETRMNLPASDPKKWYSFEQYLEYYNLSDVKPTCFALLKQFETYFENFGTYPMSSLGLPSYAKNVMYDMYNEKSPSIFTFSEKEACNTFRNQTIGGLTSVYKRHVTLMDEDAPFAAKYNKEGKAH